MKPKLIILIGSTCTGKSTWSKSVCIGNNNVVRISRREIVFILRGAYYVEKPFISMAQVMVDVAISVALKNGKNVLLDDYNTSKELLDHYIDSFGHVFDIYYKLFEGDLPKLIERAKERFQKQDIGFNREHIEKCCDEFSNLKPILIDMVAQSRIKSYNPEVNLSYYN